MIKTITHEVIGYSKKDNTKVIGRAKLTKEEAKSFIAKQKNGLFPNWTLKQVKPYEQEYLHI